MIFNSECTRNHSSAGAAQSWTWGGEPWDREGTQREGAEKGAMKWEGRERRGTDKGRKGKGKDHDFISALHFSYFEPRPAQTRSTGSICCAQTC